MSNHSGSSARVRPRAKLTLPRRPRVMASVVFQEALTANEIERLMETLGLDELHVLKTVAERLTLGRGTYGELRLLNDRRDFAREAFEESIDLAIYSAAGFVRRHLEAAEVTAAQDPNAGDRRLGIHRRTSAATDTRSRHRRAARES